MTYRYGALYGGPRRRPLPRRPTLPHGSLYRRGALYCIVSHRIASYRIVLSRTLILSKVRRYVLDRIVGFYILIMGGGNFIIYRYLIIIYLNSCAAAVKPSLGVAIVPTVPVRYLRHQQQQDQDHYRHHRQQRHHRFIIHAHCTRIEHPRPKRDLSSGRIQPSSARAKAKAKAKKGGANIALSLSRHLLRLVHPLAPKPLA